MVTTRRSVAVSKATASESTKQNADYNLSSDQDSESEEYDESDDDNFKGMCWPPNARKPSVDRDFTRKAPMSTAKPSAKRQKTTAATKVKKGEAGQVTKASCGAKGIPCVDWYLRKRVCIACKKKHLVFSGKVKSRFPDYEREAFEYVTYTNTSGWTNGRKSNSKYYWDDDVHPIVEEWSNLEHAAHLGQIGAKDNLEKWKKQRVDKLEYVAKMAPKYEAWESRMSFTKLNNAQDNRAKRLAAVKAKFLELGYEAVDIDRALSVHSDGIRTGTANVTNAASPEEMDRQDVFHVTTHSSGDVTFRIAPDTLAAEAKAATPSIWASALAWSCNHCHNFVEREDARSQSEILQHLKTKHAIIDPVVTRDYFPNERCRDLLEAPYTPAKPPVLKTFQCLQCPSGSSSNRRFNEPGVRNHLKDKHKVLDPIANTYFKNHAACQ
ncbi:hypothetical protein MD484_g2083, partial [Candolleomyces efflorescens]